MTRLKAFVCAGLWLGVWLCLTSAARAADPGAELPPTSDVSDQKLGSVLIYPFYISSAAASPQEDTVFTITNHNVTDAAFVRLLFVSNAGQVADSHICLTAAQTARFLASDVVPGEQGYAIAVAVAAQGQPLNFNYLEGATSFKLSSGQRGSLKALAIAAINLPVFSGATATLNFDGAAYNRLPRTLAADQLKSAADGNQTLLVLARIGGNLASPTGGLPLGQVSGSLYNAAGDAFPFSFNSSATQFSNLLSNSFPNTTPPFDQVIPAGRVGWLHLATDADAGLVGALLNFNGNAGGQANAFTNGRWLRALTLASSSNLTILVTPPAC